VRKKSTPPRSPPNPVEAVIEQVVKPIGRPSRKTPEVIEAVLIRVS